MKKIPKKNNIVYVHNICCKLYLKNLYHDRLFYCINRWDFDNVVSVVHVTLVNITQNSI